MLDEAEIRKEIARLEYEESSYPNYAKLADLYTIQNRLLAGEPRNASALGYSGTPAPEEMCAEVVGSYGDSDFLKALEGRDPARVWPIMDELMDTLLMVNRRVYDSVMQKIQKTAYY